MNETEEKKADEKKEEGVQLPKWLKVLLGILFVGFLVLVIVMSYLKNQGG